jgi:hypothetical protein
MDYFTSAKGMMITHDRALQEIAKHGALADLPEFYREYGKRETYKATDILVWLGY